MTRKRSSYSIGKSFNRALEDREPARAVEIIISACETDGSACHTDEGKEGR
jgi:hypothetical protein